MTNQAIKFTMTKQAFEACTDVAKSSEFAMLYSIFGTKLGEVRVQNWEEFCEDITKESLKVNKNELNILVNDNEISFEISMHVLHETCMFMRKIAPIIMSVITALKSAYDLLRMTADKFDSDLTKIIMKQSSKRSK